MERDLAPEALLIIRKLYVIEKLARDSGMTPEQRHRLRNEKAWPIWGNCACGSKGTGTQRRRNR